MTQEPTELFTRSVVKHIDVNTAKYAFVTSLAQFGGAPVKGTGMLKWAKAAFGDAIEIGPPVYDDITLEPAWPVTTRRSITITDSKVRWGNPLDFKYSLNLAIGADER